MDKYGDILKGENFYIYLSLLNKDRFKAELTENKYVVGIRPEYFVLSET